MLQIAREVSNSETAFVLRSPSNGENSKSDESLPYDVQVRFFTPTTEVPICGHATIATHVVRAIEEHAYGRIMQKTNAGILPVDVTDDNGLITVGITQGMPEIHDPFDQSIVDEIVSALGLRVDDLRSDCPVCIASTGHAKVMVGIKSLDQLSTLQPDPERLTSLSSQIGCNGYYVFTLHPGEDALVHGRMFAPAIGNDEDPVTGNANGPLGAYMVHFGLFPELQKNGELNFSIVQGEAIGRRGTMDVRVTIDDGEPSVVQIFGHAVIVFKADIEL